MEKTRRWIVFLLFVHTDKCLAEKSRAVSRQSILVLRLIGSLQWTHVVTICSANKKLEVSL